MTDHKLKGMGCEFDDLISDTAKVSETTGNSMSEREAAMESAQWLDDCAEGMEEEGLDRENNARHFRTGAKYIRAALSAPAVPVIDGLDEAIEEKVWVDIPGYEGIYQISDAGDVRVVKTGLIKKQCKNQKGYPCVGLTKDKISKTQRVHRLMAISFLNASDEHVTNHIDGNKENNNLKNLELVSMRENTTHGYNSSGKTGSILDKESGRWIASIKINGQNVYLGRYATQEQAHQAYLNALEENCIQNKYAYAELQKGF